jgi:hypothetical protein
MNKKIETTNPVSTRLPNSYSKPTGSIKKRKEEPTIDFEKLFQEKLRRKENE